MWIWNWTFRVFFFVWQTFFKGFWLRKSSDWSFFKLRDLGPYRFGHVWWFIDGSVPFSLWLAIDWYTFPMAPLTVVPVVFVCASRSEPLSGDDVTPCNLPVEPLNEAAGVGRFFLSLNGLNDQISPSLSTV